MSCSLARLPSLQRASSLPNDLVLSSRSTDVLRLPLLPTPSPATVHTPISLHLFCRRGTTTELGTRNATGEREQRREVRELHGRHRAGVREPLESKRCIVHGRDTTSRSPFPLLLFSDVTC